MAKKKAQFVKGGSDSTGGDLSKAIDIADLGEVGPTPISEVVREIWACGKGMPDGLTKKQIAECKKAETAATTKLGALVADAIKRNDSATIEAILKTLAILNPPGGKVVPVDPERALVLRLFAWLDGFNNMPPTDARKIKALERHDKQRWALRIGTGEGASRIEALVSKGGKLIPTIQTCLLWGKAHNVQISRFTAPRIAKELGRELPKAPTG